MNDRNEQKVRENAYSQTNRLEKTEKFQPDHNHEEDLILTFLLLFDQ
jgi:hypothetical protein